MGDRMTVILAAEMLSRDKAKVETQNAFERQALVQAENHGSRAAPRPEPGDTASDDEIFDFADERFAHGDLAGGVRVLLERATRLAKASDFAGAMQFFYQARASLTEQVTPARLARTVTSTRRKLRAECDSFAAIIAERMPADGKNVFVFADSLGLPRSEDASLPDAGAQETYADKIQSWSTKRGASLPVRTHAQCQRYFTTDDVVERLTEVRSQLQSGFVFVHVGLNDCASRVFSEAERLAVPFLDEPTEKLLLNFVRTYRRPIIHRQPEYTYVPLDRFVQNLEKIVKISRTHGAKHVAFANIIMPALKSESSTPHVRWNFTRYNLAIYDVAKRLSAHVVDVDRLCWSTGLGKALRPDGQHLGSIGHDLVAEAYLDLIAPVIRSSQGAAT